MEMKPNTDKNCNLSSSVLINYDLPTVFENNNVMVNSKDFNLQTSAQASSSSISKPSTSNNNPPDSNNNVSSLTSKLASLQLQPTATASSRSERLAGYTRTSLPEISSVLVQVATGSRILDVKTALFWRNRPDEYFEVGRIREIFGSVYQPQYLIELNASIDPYLVTQDEKLFYFHDHPDTGYLKVRREKDDSFTVFHERADQL